MFSKKICKQFINCASQFQEGLWLYLRLKAVLYRNDIETCTLSVVFPLFCSTPLDITTLVLKSSAYEQQEFKLRIEVTVT
jgi:hypothetical protein